MSGPLDLWATLPLSVALAAIAIEDWRHHTIRNVWTLPLLLGGLALAGWREGALPVSHLAGAGLGWALFAGLGEVFYRTKGVEGLGLGDAKLLAAAGAWLGAWALPGVVMVASMSALGFVAMSSLPGSTRVSGRSSRPVAFGPWLGLAFLVGWVNDLAGCLVVLPGCR